MIAFILFVGRGGFSKIQDTRARILSPKTMQCKSCLTIEARAQDLLIQNKGSDPIPKTMQGKSCLTIDARAQDLLIQSDVLPGQGKACLMTPARSLKLLHHRLTRQDRIARCVFMCV